MTSLYTLLDSRPYLFGSRQKIDDHVTHCCTLLQGRNHQRDLNFFLYTVALYSWSIANNFVEGFYCRCLDILCQIAFSSVANYFRSYRKSNLVQNLQASTVDVYNKVVSYRISSKSIKNVYNVASIFLSQQTKNFSCFMI